MPKRMPKRKRITSSAAYHDLPVMDLRTLLPLPQQAGSAEKRLCVVGAGFAGLALSAEYLVNTDGAKVTLYEQRHAINYNGDGQSEPINFLARGSISEQNPGRSSASGLHYKSPLTAWRLFFKNQRDQWLQYKTIRRAVEIDFFLDFLSSQKNSSQSDELSEEHLVAGKLEALIKYGDNKFGDNWAEDSDIMERLVRSFEERYSDLRSDVIKVATSRFQGLFRQGHEQRNLYAAIPSEHQSPMENQRTIKTTRANMALGKWIAPVLFRERQLKKSKSSDGNSSMSMLKAEAKAAFDEFSAYELTLYIDKNPSSTPAERKQFEKNYADLWEEISEEVESSQQSGNLQEKLEFFEACFPADKAKGLGSYLEWAHELNGERLNSLKAEGVISPSTTFVACAHAERQWDPAKLGAESSRLLNFFKNVGKFNPEYSARVVNISKSPGGVAGQVVRAKIGNRIMDLDDLSAVAVCAYKGTYGIMRSKHESEAVLSNAQSAESSNSSQAETSAGHDERRSIAWRHKVIVEIDAGELENVRPPVMYIFGEGNPGGAMVTPLGAGRVGITQIGYTNVLRADHISGDGNNQMPFKFCQKYSNQFDRLFGEFIKQKRTSEEDKITLQNFSKKAAVIRFSNDEEHVSHELEAIYNELTGCLSGSETISLDDFKSDVAGLVNKLKIHATVNIIKNAAIHHPWLEKYAGLIEEQGDDFELDTQYQGEASKVKFSLRQGNVFNSGSSNTKQQNPLDGFNARDEQCISEDPHRSVIYFMAVKASVARADAELAVCQLSKLHKRIADMEADVEKISKQATDSFFLEKKQKHGTSNLRITIKPTNGGQQLSVGRDKLENILQAWCTEYIANHYADYPKPEPIDSQSAQSGDYERDRRVFRLRMLRALKSFYTVVKSQTRVMLNPIDILIRASQSGASAPTPTSLFNSGSLVFSRSSPFYVPNEMGSRLAANNLIHGN